MTGRDARRHRWTQRDDNAALTVSGATSAVDGVRTPFGRAADMIEDRIAEWLTYEQAAERLGVTAEAVRQKAIRGRWQRARGNDGKARVRLPEGCPDTGRTPSVRPNANGVRTPSERVSGERLFKALEDHVETLKRDLAAREADLATARSNLAGERAERDSVNGEWEAERATALARLAELQATLDAERRKLDAERERADKAIAAHLELAGRVASDRARPWWRRLAG